jgi:hypothetical protein
LRTIKVLIAIAATVIAFERSASAQTMFTASLGNSFGGDASSSKTAWAVALAGVGAHGIGAEIEYSETRDFFETPEGLSHGKVVSLMPALFVQVPIGPVRPYGIFGFGCIRQRTSESEGGLLSNVTADDVGYNVGGGVILKFAPHAGVRADRRHFKVRTSGGLSFQRFLVGFVLGG